MNRTQIYLPKTQLSKLKGLAVKRGSTVSEIVRDILDEHLVLTPKRAKSAQQYGFTSIARKIGKLGQKGPKDLAKNMDKYLYGDGKKK